MINKMLDYREVQRKRLESNPELSLGDVNTVNLTMVNGGLQANVVPEKLVLTFDVRITPTSDLNGRCERFVKLLTFLLLSIRI